MKLEKESVYGFNSLDVFNMRKKSSILLLSPTFPYHSDQRHTPWFVYQFVKNTIDAGVNMTVVSSRSSELSKEDLEKSESTNFEKSVVNRFPYFFTSKMESLTRGESGIPYKLFTNREILSWIQLPFFLFSFFINSIPHAKKCDIIHCQWVMSAIPGLLLKWLFKKPLYITIRAGNPSLVSNNIILRYIVRNADYLLATADEYFVHFQICGADSSKFIKIRNGINPFIQQMNKSEVRKKLGLDNDRKILVTTSYLIPRKNPKLLLDSFIKLSKENENLDLVFVGDGPLRNKLSLSVKENGLSNRVTFTGNLNAKETNYWLNASDIFCLPTNSDGLSNSVTEAMYCSLPVVATTGGSFSGIILEGETGFLVRPGDLNDMTNKIESLVVDSKLRNRIGLNAKRHLSRMGINWNINGVLHRKAYDKSRM